MRTLQVVITILSVPVIFFFGRWLAYKIPMNDSEGD